MAKFSAAEIIPVEIVPWQPPRAHCTGLVGGVGAQLGVIPSFHCYIVHGLPGCMLSSLPGSAGTVPDAARAQCRDALEGRGHRARGQERLGRRWAGDWQHQPEQLLSVKNCCRRGSWGTLGQTRGITPSVHPGISVTCITWHRIGRHSLHQGITPSLHRGTRGPFGWWCSLVYDDHCGTGCLWHLQSATPQRHTPRPRVWATGHLPPPASGAISALWSLRSGDTAHWQPLPVLSLQVWAAKHHPQRCVAVGPSARADFESVHSFW